MRDIAEKTSRIARCTTIGLTAAVVLCAMVACEPSVQPLEEATVRRVLKQGKHPDIEVSLNKGAREELLALYESKKFAPLWTAKHRPTDSALDLIDELRSAEARGLQSQAYAGERLSQRARHLAQKRKASPSDVTLFDLALTLASAQLVSDLHAGRIDPRKMGHDLEVPHRDFDRAAAVTALAAARDVTPVLDRYEPTWNQYRLLKQALARNRASSAPDEKRARQIEIALERWRWLPARPEGPVIFVNVPQFELFVYEENAGREIEALRMDVAVGSALRQAETPIFIDTLTYLVLWPHWNVPESIVKEELWPQITTNPRWFTDKDFEIVTGPEEESVVLPPTPNALAALEQGEARLRQRPGFANALGRIKFMLPNRHNVYLHDTPAKALFKATRRDFSHGCIRLAEPIVLANYVLRANPNWNPSRLQAALERPSTEPINVSLLHPVPVFVIYATTYASQDGQVFFFEDIYEHDAKLDRALRAIG